MRNHKEKKDMKGKSQIYVYLTFGGNCNEAMTFYRDCIGGELSLQTIGDSPMADDFPVSLKHYILHSTLYGDSILLMASDMVGNDGLIKGSNVSLMLDCQSEKEILTLYERLSKGGVSEHPVEETFWGTMFGDLTDKYGNRWLLNYTPPLLTSLSLV